jgi:putative flippase GtrA
MRRIVDRLRDVAPGFAGQGVRFVLAGLAVALVYLLATTALAYLAGLPFEIALLLGFGLGLLTHFTLQRHFVWVGAGEYALPLRRQAGRYLTVAGIQYGLTAASTSLLPAALGLPTEMIYLLTAALFTVGNFVVFRRGIFHAKPYDAGVRSADAPI